MKLDKPLSSIRRLLPEPDKKLGKVVTATAGAAAAVWVLLRLRRELYGPGGTKLSRYDPDVDDVWDERDDG